MLSLLVQCKITGEEEDNNLLVVFHWVSKFGNSTFKVLLERVFQPIST